MPSYRDSRSRHKKVDPKTNIPGHRPVGARAQKSAIDTLRPWIANSQVLDLYAGSGRFGLSALKEGASFCTFVEKIPSLAQKIRFEIERFYPNQGTVTQDDALLFLRQAVATQKRFDLIFVDPPFELWTKEFSQTLCPLLEQLLAPNAILLVKYPSKMVAFLEFKILTAWKSVDFGESRLLYFRME